MRRWRGVWLLVIELRRRRRRRRELLRVLLRVRVMVVLIGVLLVRLADSLCLCLGLGLNLLESILCLFASFIEEVHNCHQIRLKLVIYCGDLTLLLPYGSALYSKD